MELLPRQQRQNELPIMPSSHGLCLVRRHETSLHDSDRRTDGGCKDFY
jgi:hypothetical protein